MRFIPTYEQALQLTQLPNSPFYETKLVIEGYPISVFNYRLAEWKDFANPIDGSDINGYEMRGLTFVFGQDGNLFSHFLLLHKFFNLNQVPETLENVLSNYKISEVHNKEDGSIASFIKLPNGKILGKSKMGFDNDQALGINKIYSTNEKIKQFVDWTLDNNIVAIFEYVSPQNRIVLKYKEEELILLKLRDNNTGKYLRLNDYSDKINGIKLVESFNIDNIDSLINLTKNETEKEGYVVTCVDNNGEDFFFKIKTPWYNSLHGLLTEDIYRENVLIEHILDERIDDILSQIPIDDVQSHDRINKIIVIVKKSINDKMLEIEKEYGNFVTSGMSKKDYALKNRVNPNFSFVMNMVKGDSLRNLSKEQILEIYDTMDEYEISLKRCNPYEMSKEWIRDMTKRLKISREWLKKKDSTLFFQDPEESGDN